MDFRFLLAHFLSQISHLYWIVNNSVVQCRHGDLMVVGFTTICAISTYDYYSCEFELCSWQGVLDRTLCDKVCQWLSTGQWLSLGSLCSSTNKTDNQDITVLLLKPINNQYNDNFAKKNMYNVLNFWGRSIFWWLV